MIGPHNLHLTPMVFRQISGRAGRRGYDTYGDVITFGMERALVERLVTSRLPPIYGRMPFNCGFVMRYEVVHESSSSYSNRSNSHSILE